MLEILKKMITQKELEAQERALIVYTMMILNGFIYLLLAVMISFSIEGKLFTASFYLYLSNLALFTTIGIMTVKQAVAQEWELSRGIIRLAIIHAPILISFMYWLLTYFEIL